MYIRAFDTCVAALPFPRGAGGLTAEDEVGHGGEPRGRRAHDGGPGQHRVLAPHGGLPVRGVVEGFDSGFYVGLSSSLGFTILSPHSLPFT